MDEVDLSYLPKKERKRLKQEMERADKASGKKRGLLIKISVITGVFVILAVGGYFLSKELSKPLPGKQFESQGRDHVPQDQWSKFAYNSNPPTSGPHDPVWTNTGIYDQSQGDGHLIHSLEHGYIVISYNCNMNPSEASSSALIGGGEASISGKLPSSFTAQDCDGLKKELSDLANVKKLWKLVVVPRPNLDRRIALAAWTRLEKLDSFDKDKIVAFIDALRNHGPEQTME